MAGVAAEDRVGAGARAGAGAIDGFVFGLGGISGLDWYGSSEKSRDLGWFIVGPLVLGLLRSLILLIFENKSKVCAW